MTVARSVAHETVAERYVFPAYVAFSVCFYSLRFIYGWGFSGTTLYDSDMPWYLAAIKDVAWLILIGTALAGNGMSRAVAQVKRHPVFYGALGSFCFWICFCSAIHMLFLEEPLQDGLLFNVRLPLEYVPAAFLAPAFVQNFGELGSFWKKLNLVAIGFAIYEIVAVESGWKVTGFGYGGIDTRFGGILGSPNDWGIYCGCTVLVLLAARSARLQLLAFVPGLLLTQSRSAILATLVASTALFRAPARPFRMLVWACLLGVLLWGAARWADVGSVVDILPERVGMEDSAMTRFDQLALFRDEFIRNDDARGLLLGRKRFHIEIFYLALLVHGGIPALVLFLGVLCASFVRGWRLRRRSVIHACALCVVLLIAVASVFVPYPDTYPSNFYLWLAIGILWMEPQDEPPAVEDGSPEPGAIAATHAWA